MTTQEPAPNKAHALNADREYPCIVTDYVGNEHEVLRLRNASRESPETRKYVDWRYQTPPGSPSPKVFWLLSASGERVGMASLIFRRYWRNGGLTHLAVLGDISVAQSLRGRGLGQRLLRFTTDYLSEHFPDCYGFVIPTEAARRSLEAIGWSTAGKLIPHVLAIDPAPKLRALVRSVWLTQRICQIYRGLARMLLRRHLIKDSTLQSLSEPDEALGELWRSSPRDGCLMRDLGVQSLRWRYASHPRTRFTFVKLMRGGDLRAFMVLSLDAESRTCSIYDVLADSVADLSCILAQYALGAMERRDVSTVRISVNDKHPYRRNIRMLGFMSRRPGAPFQGHPRSATDERTRWSITLGDKDV
jgi:GNAT superfamily N-acetyltransferase